MTENCPECGGEAEHVDEGHGIHLYVHRDDYAQCVECGHFFAYRGVATEDENAGFAFYDAESGKGAERPTCPKHGVKMWPTKVWPSEDRVQFKCDEDDEDAEKACQRVQYRDLTSP